MVSAFEVYLVLQLDSIGTAAFVAFLVLLALILIPRINDTMLDRKTRPYNKTLVAAAVLCFITSALLPSSKTAAAMIIVPALTSKGVVEPLTAEAKDLYALAKGALKKVVEAAPEPKTEEVK